MGAYLTDHPPVRDQWYARRNRPLTGCTVLHTAESIMDTIGPDSGAESVAEFIRTRTTPGSYHDICDSDTAVYLVDYGHGAYHDGTGSNNWALSISWACRTSDWHAMSPETRKGFLRQGAIAFARQQAYRRSIGAPLTELRLITKAQSDRGESGFTYHGYRDPGRRSDPGVSAPNLFPFDEFISECRAVLRGSPTPLDLGDDMRVLRTPDGTIWLATDTEVAPIGAAPALPGGLRLAGGAAKVWNRGDYIAVSTEELVALRADADSRRGRRADEIAVAAAKLVGTPDVDEAALAVALAPKLNGSSVDEIAAALRGVLREGVGA